MKRIVVVGHAALDHVWRIDEFPPRPSKVRAHEHIVAGGGMAANAAAAIARLGGRVELWSRTGKDEAGVKIRALLAEEGVGVDHVKAFAGAQSSCSAVIVDSHGERMAIGTRSIATPVDAGWLPLERIPTAGAVLSDLRWIEGTRAAFRRAREASVTTVLDADLESGPVLDEILALTDYAIFPAGSLTAFAPEVDEATRLARVMALGPRHAGVTRGAKGYRWLSRGGRSGEVPAFPVEVVDTTGAGDAFHGAFVWALVRGCGDEDASRIASAAAALKCRMLGARAGLPRRDEIESFLAAVQIPSPLEAEA